MFSFTFRQVEVFLEVCRSGSFSQAAKRLRVSQPSISSVMGSLEKQLGVGLFIRLHGASVELTRAGASFRDCAQLYVARCESLCRSARGVRYREATKPAPLRAFVGGHLLEDFVRPRLPAFLEQYPQLQLEFLPERSREKLLRDVRAGRIDVAVITAPRVEPTPATLHLGEVPAGIYCSRPIRGPLTPSRISALPFYMPSARTTLVKSMLQAMADAGIVPRNIAGYYQHHDVRIRMVGEHGGATFSLQSVIDAHDHQRRLRLVFPTEPWVRKAYIHPRVDPPIAAALASFFTLALAPVQRSHS